MGENAAPKIEIRANGYQSKIFIDGVEVKGIRSYSIEHEAGRKPILRVDLVATDVTVDCGGILPELPYPISQYYKKKDVTPEDIAPPPCATVRRAICDSLGEMQEKLRQ